MRTQRIIALGGKPTSGKNEVGRILQERFGAVLVDDGLPLRLAAPFLFHGVDVEDCLSQEGKKKIVVVNGKEFTVRQLLGDVGQLLEAYYGEFYIPDQIMQRLPMLPPANYYVLTACRKRQGHFFRQMGQTVFYIDRDVPDSPHAFDKFDTTAANDTISNKGSLEELEAEVMRVMHKRFYDPGFTRLLAK